MKNTILFILLLMIPLFVFADGVISGRISLLYITEHDVSDVNANVRFTAANGTVVTTTTNSEGYYSLNINSGLYGMGTFLFTKPNYADLTLNLNINGSTSQLPYGSMAPTSLTIMVGAANVYHPPHFYSTFEEAVLHVNQVINDPRFIGPVNIYLQSGTHYLPYHDNEWQGDYDVFGFSLIDSAPNPNLIPVKFHGNNGVHLRTPGNNGLIVSHNKIRGVALELNNITMDFASNQDQLEWWFFVEGQGNMMDSKCTFNNCKFGIQDSNPASIKRSKLHIKNINQVSLLNSSIKNCRTTQYSGEPEFYAVLRIDGCNQAFLENTQITNNNSARLATVFMKDIANLRILYCDFLANTTSLGIDPNSGVESSSGSTVYIRDVDNIRIETSDFVANHTAGYSSPLHINNSAMSSVPLYICDNTFINNVADNAAPDNNTIASESMYFNNITFNSNDTIARNIVVSNTDAILSDYLRIGGNCSGNLTLLNWDFIRGTGDNDYAKQIIRSTSPVNIAMVNNLFDMQNMNASFQVPAASNINANYSLFSLGYQGLDNVANSQTNVALNLDASYRPIWNASTMSPCIDSGIGEDEDGTPADIGALQAVQHSYWDYAFTNQAAYDRWYWVSYPVLNTTTTNALKASEFFNELLLVHPDSQNNDTPTYLDQIIWYNQGPFSITWVAGEWLGPMNTHFVSSPQGYKILLKTDIDPEFSWPVHLTESGFQTSDTTQFPIYGSMENWLGYFKEESQYPADAFANIWSDVTMVRGKNWSLERDPVSGLMIGKNATINYGDLVIVKTNNNHPTFQWDTTNPVPPEKKALPKSFVYDEKQDYIPVYISLSDSLMTDLNEIGLYVDGVCKGAVVVEENLEQISAYVESADELNEADVEFVFSYDDNKSMGPQMRSMKLPAGNLQAKYGQAGPSYPYFEIKLSEAEMGNVLPPELTLKQNYPNPFNPTTTIAYNLPEAAKVRLDIYNVKGQLVKTLVNDEMPAGPHSVVWNGKDINDNAVASGVYFYRVSSPNATQTKRMLLMK